MLVDGFQLADNSPVTRQLMDSTKVGTEFPSSPSDGDVFQLTTSYNSHGPGIYTYVSSETRWIAKYPNNDIIPYDVAGATFGVMADGAVISRHVSVRTYRIKSGFSGCIAVALIAAVQDTYIDIIRVSRSGAETVLGQLFFEVAETTGVFIQSGSGDMNFTAGEHLVLKGPSTADATLSDLAFTFAGTLV